MKAPQAALVTRGEILGLAVPALGSLVADPLLGMVDTAFMGRVGAPELAALGASTALIGLLVSTLIFLEYGTTARLARRFGSGEMRLLSLEALQMGYLATALGILLTVLFTLFADVFLTWTGVTGEVLVKGTLYLRIRALAMVPSLWLLAGHGVFRGLQDTRTPLGLVVGMNLLNAVLDLLLIFGFSPLHLPAMGIAGAAWASVLASWAGGLGFFFILVRRLPSQGLLSREHLLPHWGTLREMLAICRDLLLRTLALRAALFSGTRAVALLGTIPLAAHQIAWQLWMFLALLLDSLAIAGQSLLGRLLGAGDSEQAWRVGQRLHRWGLGLGIALALIFLLLRDFLPGIFTRDPEVRREVQTIFLLISLMQIPNALLFVLDGLLIGASDLAFLRNAMTALGALGVITAWLGGKLLGSLFGVWAGISVFMLARLLFMDLRWRSRAWVGSAAAAEET